MSSKEFPDNLIFFPDKEIEEFLENAPPPPPIDPHFAHRFICEVFDKIDDLPAGTTLWRSAIEGNEIAKEIIQEMQTSINSESE